MSSTPLFIDGIALWSPQLPSWELAAPALRGELPATTAAIAASRPSAALLSANERRRAPDAVLLALEVAAAACADSGHAPATLASVFSSAHGDLPTTDAMCRTLAADPLLLSPTRFHHSVHNAASGYWAITSGSHAASTALSAHEDSFAAAWLEAASQCQLEQQPLLLVAYDTAAVGTLASVSSSRGLLALALVLSPQQGARSRFKVGWSVHPAAELPTPLRSPAALALSANAMAPGLVLFEALAAAAPTAVVALRLSAGAASLQLRLSPLHQASGDM